MSILNQFFSKTAFSHLCKKRFSSFPLHAIKNFLNKFNRFDLRVFSVLLVRVQLNKYFQVVVVWKEYKKQTSSNKCVNTKVIYFFVKIASFIGLTNEMMRSNHPVGGGLTTRKAIATTVPTIPWSSLKMLKLTLHTLTLILNLFIMSGLVFYTV